MNSRMLPLMLLLAMLPAGAAMAQLAPPVECRSGDSAYEVVDPLFDAFMKRDHVPGVVYGVVHRGRLVHCKAVGVRDVASGEPVTYGSNVLLIPEHDIGIFAFANRTYAPAALVLKQAAARLYDTAALKAVNKRGSDALVRIEQAVARIYASGSVTAEPQALAVNLLLDRSAARRDRELQALRAQLGECRARSEMDVRHSLSAVLRYQCDRGTLTATVLLAPFRSRRCRGWTSPHRTSRTFTKRGYNGRMN